MASNQAESGMRRSFAATVVACAFVVGAVETSEGDSGRETDAQISRLIAEASSPDWKKRMAAVQELGRRGAGAEAAIPALIARLADTDPPLPKRGESGWHFTWVVDPGPTIGEKAAAALAAIGPAAEPSVRAALSRGGLHTRCCAALALAHLGEADAAQHLAGLLPSAFDAVQESRHKSAPRLAMIKALGKMRNPIAIPALRQAVGRDQWVSNQVDAVRSIAEIGGDEAVAALRATCKEKHFPGVRDTSLRMLVRLLGARAKPDVQAMLQDKDSHVRDVAQRLLADVAQADDVGRLCRLLRSADAAQRVAAVRALAKVKSPEAVPALLAALRDSNEKVRKGASEALRAMQEPSAAPGLLEFIQSAKKGPLRDTALQTLAATSGDQAKAALCLLLLQHPEADVRLGVLRYLQHRVGKDEAVRETIQTAAAEDPDDKVRLKANEMLSSWQRSERFQENVSQWRRPR